VVSSPRSAAAVAGPGDLDVRDVSGGASLRVRVTPRSKHDAIGGTREGALIVRLTAPPVDGAANSGLARVLGKALGVAPSAIELVKGATGRDKVVHVSGRTASEIRAALAAYL
jgi:uncharacterized protein (TIGR00251 family)